MSPHDAEVAVAAFDELLNAAAMFGAHGMSKKVAVFGSARTKPDSPLFQLAEQISKSLATHGWMTVSGAGPGIMEAAAKGAGPSMTLGVNIELPFEQFPNPYVDVTSKLVAMEHFFTRKVAMTRPSNAFVVFPGGLGTMDELYEVLTLLNTGKAHPAPVVLVDAPDGSFWTDWLAYGIKHMVDEHYVAPQDFALVSIVTTAQEAVDVILGFYRNFVSVVFDSERAIINTIATPTPSQLESLREKFPQFSHDDAVVLESPSQFKIGFNGRSYVDLKRLIDLVNTWV
jgi:uncharacterized protein (TIGR00730 family)